MQTSHHKFSVVVGLDKHTLKYFEVTNGTWFALYPDLARRPWVVFYDPESVSEAEIDAAFDVSGVKRNITYVPWIGCGEYETQREKMLSGHVYISHAVETEYFLKIDADAIACEVGPWPRAEWFEGDPVLAGPTWGYTRAKGDNRDLFEWVEELERFGDKYFGTPRAGWKDRIGSLNHPKGPKLKCGKRFVSWLGFQRTEWVQEMASLFEEEYGSGRLPVPSHDTSLWAAAIRSGAKIVATPVKPMWTNRTTIRGCESLIDELGFMKE